MVSYLPIIRITATVKCGTNPKPLKPFSLQNVEPNKTTTSVTEKMDQYLND